MKDNDRKKKIIIAIIGVLVLLVVLGSATYAFFSATDTEEAKQITTAKEELDVKIEGSTHIENIKPTNKFNVSLDVPLSGIVKLNKRNIDVVTIPINVTNNSSIDINYNLTLRAKNLKLNSDNNLIGGTTEDIKWVLYKLNSKDGDADSPESYGDFYDVTFVNKMITEVSIIPDETHYYILFIYIEETETNQNKLQNISFDVEISGNTKSLDIAGKKLVDVILNNSVIKDREPNYNLVEYIDAFGSKNLELQDIGLFKLNGKNIYYNRGPVYFNDRVYFGTHKSGEYAGYPLAGLPISWRILRINEDKSVTLIYDTAEPPYSTYNSSGKSDYIGSEAEQVLKSWYENTFNDKEKALIQETTFCNDTSDNYEGAKNRLIKDIPEPTLDCREEDKVQANIGLVTADELVYMGAVYNENNSSSENYNRYGRLLNLGFTSRVNTMTPSSENTIFYSNKEGTIISSDGKTNYDDTYTRLTPVITLSSDATIAKSITTPSGILKSNYNMYMINP